MMRWRGAAATAIRWGAAVGVVALLLWGVRVAAAQDGGDPAHRAGVVIVHGDGSVVQRCVRFAEESISGYELLQRAGVDLSADVSSMGATICRIDREGCGFPEQSCFCRCEGSPCTYWSYWRLAPAGWFYQNLGAGNTKVHDGDLEAWHWSAGTVNDAPAPPPATLAQVCGGTTPSTTQAALLPAPAVVTAPHSAAAPSLALSPAAAGALTPAVGGQADEAAAGGAGVGLLLAVVAVLVIVPVGLGVVVVVRRRRMPGQESDRQP